MNRFQIIVLLLAATLGVSVYAQNEAVILKRAAVLRDAPGETGRSLLNLPTDTALTRLPVRQGGWIEVRTSSGSTGWVHMFDVGSASAPSNTATDALRGLSNFFNSGGSQGARHSTATSTVGIRGLGAEDIAQAQPNITALAQVEGLRQDATQARRFAADANLRPRTVDPLPVPTPPAAAKSESNPRFSQ